MAASNGERAEPKHRPLPSVKLALLPHEVRAARMRYVTFGVLSLLALAVGAAVAFGRDLLHALETPDAQVEADDPWPSEQAGQPAPEVLAPSAAAALTAGAPAERAEALAVTDEATEPQPQPESTSTGALGTVVRPFGKARGFRDALLSAGASGEEADALVEALQKEVDFRRCRPEHDLAFTRDATGRLQSFEYRTSITDIYRAEREPAGGFRAFKADVPVDHRRVAKGGYVADSLGRALDGLGLGRSLAGAFVEAFEGIIDFKKHTREGDSFKLIVEERYVDGKFLGYGDILALEYAGERSGRKRAFWFEGKDGKGDFHDESGRAIHGGWLRTPLRYDHISSRYDLRRRHPILKRIVPHHGIDYAAAPGTPVWAAAAGVVTFAGYRGANGNLVALRHASGYETFYAHLSRISGGIKKGVRVEQRQTIGAVGSTGRSTGPHLHFGLKRHGRFVNPEKQLNGPGKPLPGSLMARFRPHVRELKAQLGTIALSAAPAPAPEASDDAGSAEVFHEEVLDL